MLKLVHGDTVEVDVLRCAPRRPRETTGSPDIGDIVALVSEEGSGEIALLDVYGVVIWPDSEVRT